MKTRRGFTLTKMLLALAVIGCSKTEVPEVERTPRLSEAEAKAIASSAIEEALTPLQSEVQRLTDALDEMSGTPESEQPQDCLAVAKNKLAIEQECLDRLQEKYRELTTERNVLFDEYFTTNNSKLLRKYEAVGYYVRRQKRKVDEQRKKVEAAKEALEEAGP